MKVLLNLGFRVSRYGSPESAACSSSKARLNARIIRSYFQQYLGSMRSIPSNFLPAICLLAVTASSPVLAFHDGGVGTCGGCHIMTERPGGSPSVAQGGSLLTAENSSDLCLLCHASNYGAVLGEDPLAPPS